MFSDNLMKIYSAERVRIQAQLYELHRQVEQGEQKLRELDALMSGLEVTAKAEAERAGKAEEAQAAAEQRGFERGLLQGIEQAGGQKPEVLVVQPAKRRARGEKRDVS